MVLALEFTKNNNAEFMKFNIFFFSHYIYSVVYPYL